MSCQRPESTLIDKRLTPDVELKANLQYEPMQAPKVRRYTGPGWRTEPQAGPKAWVGVQRKDEG